jgi:hypothetical protein
MPVYVTEMGWNDHPRWSMAVTPAQRIDYTIRALRYAKSHWQQVENLCLWVFRYPLPTLGYPDNFTLVTTDFQKKPIYYALQQYAGSTGGEQALWLPPPTE